MLLIGSRAINHHLPGFRPKPADVDVIASARSVEQLLNDGFTHEAGTGRSTVLRSPSGATWDIELETPLTEALSEPWYQGREGRKQVEIEGYLMDLATLDQLYTLKLSHRYLKDSPYFMKTMLDIWALRKAGACVSSHAWLQERERATYGYKHPSLMRNKTQFFSGDAVHYVYDHDAVHQAVKLGDVPAYTRFGKDGHDVFSSRTKFEALPELHKLHAVLEEAYVLAIERSQVPYPGTDPNVSFKIALEKVCTSITSGWFREYAWEHYFVALALYSPTYVDRFDAAEPTLALARA